MSNVLFVESVTCDDADLCTVVACVSDVVVTQPPTAVGPIEYGSALCRGSFYLQDDEVIPDDDVELCRFVADCVSYWEVIGDD